VHSHLLGDLLPDHGQEHERLVDQLVGGDLVA
jgi:hypothetical protein